MKSIDIIMFVFFCSVSIIFIILIVYNYISSRKSKFLKSETRLINPPPPPPEKSIDDMSVRELYEAYEFHRNKTIELGKAVKKLESAVESLRKNKSYEI